MQQEDHLIRCEQVSMTTDETVISWELGWMWVSKWLADAQAWGLLG